jgi:hypothetical protein
MYLFQSSRIIPPYVPLLQFVQKSQNFHLTQHQDHSNFLVWNAKWKNIKSLNYCHLLLNHEVSFPRINKWETFDNLQKKHLITNKSWRFNLLLICWGLKGVVKVRIFGHLRLWNLIVEKLEMIKLHTLRFWKAQKISRHNWQS